jgi:hypothetical protein
VTFVFATTGHKYLIYYGEDNQTMGKKVGGDTTMTGFYAVTVNRHGIGTPDRLAKGTPLRVRWEGAGVVDAEP